LIAEYHQDKTRSLAIGIHMTGLYMGQALGGFGATIADKFSWQQTFHAFGFIGIVYAIVLVLFLKEKRNTEAPAEQMLRTDKQSVFKGLSVLFSNIAFWIILFYFAVPSLPGWGVKNWLPTLFSGRLWTYYFCNRGCCILFWLWLWHV